MSCAAFTVVAIIAELRKKTSRWIMKASFLLAIVFFISSSYLAWNDEHQKLIEANGRLETLNNPVLSGHIQLFGSEIDGTGFLLIASGAIRNSGAPTVLSDYHLNVRLGDGQVIVGKILDASPSPLAVPYGPNHQNLLFYIQDYWPLNSADAPIPQGGADVDG